MAKNILQPRVGDTVLYTGSFGAQVMAYPAIISSIEVSGHVNLTVFFDHKAAAGSYTGNPTSVPYSLEPKINTWRFRDDGSVAPQDVQSGGSILIVAKKIVDKSAKKKVSKKK